METINKRSDRIRCSEPVWGIIMTSQIDYLADLTMEIVKNINASTVEDLLDLVHCRDNVLNSLQLMDHISEDDRSLLTEIHVHNRLIESRMTELLDEAARGLKKIINTRVQKQSYEKLYAGESYFIDKKE